MNELNKKENAKSEARKKSKNFAEPEEKDGMAKENSRCASDSEIRWKIPFNALESISTKKKVKSLQKFHSTKKPHSLNKINR